MTITQGEWKIQLSIKINFMSSKDSDDSYYAYNKWQYTNYDR